MHADDDNHGTMYIRIKPFNSTFTTQVLCLAANVHLFIDNLRLTYTALAYSY